MAKRTMTLRNYLFTCLGLNLPLWTSLGFLGLPFFPPAQGLIEGLIFGVIFSGCAITGAAMLAIATPKSERFDFMSYKWSNLLSVFPGLLTGYLYLGFRITEKLFG